jgi:hypothetical protein
MYALVASTFDPGKESTFNIVVFSDEPIKLKVRIRKEEKHSNLNDVSLFCFLRNWLIVVL